MSIAPLQPSASNEGGMKTIMQTWKTNKGGPSEKHFSALKGLSIPEDASAPQRAHSRIKNDIDKEAIFFKQIAEKKANKLACFSFLG